LLQLEQFEGQVLYIHLEVNRGAYHRNARVMLQAAHVRGDGPYRLFLNLDDGLGLIHVDDLTHMQLTNEMVICTGYDSSDRIARTIEISVVPFSM